MSGTPEKGQEIVRKKSGILLLKIAYEP